MGSVRKESAVSNPILFDERCSFSSSPHSTDRFELYTKNRKIHVRMYVQVSLPLFYDANKVVL